LGGCLLLHEPPGIVFFPASFFLFQIFPLGLFVLGFLFTHPFPEIHTEVLSPRLERLSLGLFRFLFFFGPRTPSLFFGAFFVTVGSCAFLSPLSRELFFLPAAEQPLFSAFLPADSDRFPGGSCVPSPDPYSLSWYRPSESFQGRRRFEGRPPLFPPLSFSYPHSVFFRSNLLDWSNPHPDQFPFLVGTSSPPPPSSPEVGLFDAILGPFFMARTDLGGRFLTAPPGGSSNP